MNTINDKILSEVADYYSAKVKKHGATPQGVDWNGEESQMLRFGQLCKVLDSNQSFSIVDLGCGYGALATYLLERYSNFSYTGFDISPEMISVAREKFHSFDRVSFSNEAEPKQDADYAVASGIFNVRQEVPDDEWAEYIKHTLDILHRISGKGFAFNCLTAYSDQGKMRSYLYYADPGRLFDLCMKKYSRHVALLHDYGLYEFTIIVRKGL